MKRKTTHPGQRELFETPANAAPASECDAIRELRARLRQPQPKVIGRGGGQDAPKLSAMVRGEVYKF